MTALFGSFSNYGFIRDQVPLELFSKLKEEILEINYEKNKMNMNLAGNIEKEYKLGKNLLELEDYLLILCNQYFSNWGGKNTTKDLSPDNLKLDVYWANIQKKNEFNPMHTHDGVYSFALWIQIPYDINDELKKPNVNNSNMPRAGMFSFIYTNVFGEIREAEFPVDKSYEGTIFLFPSCLSHTVYPFSTSDGNRISISGNLKRK